jgi:hypothetical protein
MVVKRLIKMDPPLSRRGTAWRLHKKESLLKRLITNHGWR